MSVAPELQREREHLARARAELARMREQTLSLEAHGGDRVSSEFLATTLHRRARSLVDDPTSALFFGRIDRCADGGVAGAADPAGAPATAPERWYIGRRHVADAAGDPVVIDWRAQVSTAFYRASRTDADGRPAAPPVRHRPRHAHRVRGRAPDRPGARRPGRATSWPARSSARAWARCATSSRPSSPSRTTSSAPTSTTTICVQGAPGTGKTAVGLHRAA